jgi:AraC family transcriptional regulator
MFWEKTTGVGKRAGSVGGAGKLVGVDQTLIVPAGQRYHSYCKDEFEHLTVFLDPTFPIRLSLVSAQPDRIEIAYSAGQNDAFIRQIGIALASEIESETPAGPLYAESLVIALTAHLLRRYSNVNDVFQMNTGGLAKHSLRHVIEFIESNLERDLTLAEIAKEMDLSVHHFARAFKQSTGLAPHKFLVQRRIERAKALLTNPDLALAEVSLRSGFKNQSHFTTLFRKFTTTTPKAYRDRMLR